jgi:hypothetical protein
MAAISYLSSFNTQAASSIPLLGLEGPRNTLTFGWDVLAVAILSLAVYALAIRSRLPATQSLAYVDELNDEAEATASTTFVSASQARPTAPDLADR